MKHHLKQGYLAYEFLTEYLDLFFVFIVFSTVHYTSNEIRQDLKLSIPYITSIYFTSFSLLFNISLHHFKFYTNLTFAYIFGICLTLYVTGIHCQNPIQRTWATQIL